VETRYICSHCKESLAHMAYRCYQELPHMYCPACIEKDESSSGSDSTFEQICQMAMTHSVVLLLNYHPQSTWIHPVLPVRAVLLARVNRDLKYGIYPVQSEIDGSEPDRPQSQLQRMVCIFLAFFQLCFRISDNAMEWHIYSLSFLPSFTAFLQRCKIPLCSDYSVRAFPEHCTPCTNP